MSKRKTKVEAAIARLEAKIAVLQAAIVELKYEEQVKAAPVRRLKTVAVVEAK